jgi:phytoene/squalene synthetase
MHRVAANFVSRLLGEEQKQNRVYVSQELVDRANADEKFLNNIGTGYKIWIYGYDETKAQS